MSLTITPSSACYRCGYDLRDIPDDSACPECGLLAIRSRRESDELHHTRPAFLRSLAWGSRIVLLATLLALVSPVVLMVLTNSDLVSQLDTYRFWPPTGLGIRTLGGALALVLIISAFLLWAGIWLLTVKEHYPPSDRADKRLRWSLRIVGGMLCVGLILLYLPDTATGIDIIRRIDQIGRFDVFLWYAAAFVVLIVGLVGSLIFFRRWQRVRSAVTLLLLIGWIGLLIGLSSLLISVFPGEGEIEVFQTMSVGPGGTVATLVHSMRTVSTVSLLTFITTSAQTLCLLSLAALPFLLFRRFRSLAVRVRSKHLAEHCTIVGIGASLAFLYGLFTLWLDFYAPDHIGKPFMRSNYWLALNAVLLTFAIVLSLGACYLFLRFTLAFGKAAKSLRGAWRRDDRSLA